MPENINTAPDWSPPGYEELRGSDRAVAEAMRRPRWLIYGATAGAVILAWVWLTLLSNELERNSGGADTGPAMAWLSQYLQNLFGISTGSATWQWLVSLCLPQSQAVPVSSLWFAAFLMWSFMSVAMMLPSAAPLIRTYADIADVAAGKGEPVVPIIYLVAGYLTVWLGFAALAAAVQTIMVSVGLANDVSLPVQGAVAGLILLLAGAYQFSNLKHACLEKCRNPFSTLFGQWTGERAGVFQLGIQQGFFCVGCCWGLMLVMLVVGTMNLAWMAFFVLFTIVEKSGKGKVTSTLSGGIFLFWGAATILLASGIL
ncbi:MAG: DUF2182 domain-containing protein [Pseudomonadota bacterium]